VVNYGGCFFSTQRQIYDMEEDEYIGSFAAREEEKDFYYKSAG